MDQITHKHTGEFVVRKLHVLIVIPLHPLGRGEYNEKSINAFQEYINHKYDLASPKI